MMIGNDTFGFEFQVLNREGLSQLSMFIDGKDILEGRFQGKQEKYNWYIADIIHWLNTNSSHIMEEDPYPVAVSGNSAAELYSNSLDFSGTEDEEFEWYTSVQNWLFKHSWVTAAAGSQLATVFFRSINGHIEISWDNSDNKIVEFVVLRGRKLINKYVFIKTIDDLCNTFENMNAQWHHSDL